MMDTEKELSKIEAAVAAILSKPRGEVCGTCRFWNARPQTHENAECRRWPAVLHDTAAWPNSAWPFTDEVAWCGEWKQADEGQLADRKALRDLAVRADTCIEVLRAAYDAD